MHRTSSRTSLSSRALLNLRISRPLSRSLCAIPSRVKRETEQLQDVLLKINAKHLGPLERRPFTEGIPKPVVLLLGNHSSGKSSFINYVLGRDVQTTGVAPTDDGFTVIQPGTEDAAPRARPPLVDAAGLTARPSAALVVCVSIV